MGCIDMASTMLSVYNNKNILQISSDYRNLVLKRKIKWSEIGRYSPDPANNYYADVRLVLNSDELFAGVGRTDKAKFEEYGLPLSANNINRANRWYIGEEKDVFLIGFNTEDSDDTDDVEDAYVYTFGFADNVNKEDCGLEVFDEAGNIVYDSERKYVKIIGYGEQTIDNDNSVVPDTNVYGKYNSVIVPFGSANQYWSDRMYIDFFCGWYPIMRKSGQVVYHYEEWAEDMGSEGGDANHLEFMTSHLGFMLIDGSNL